MLTCSFPQFLWMSSVLAPSCSAEYSTEGRHAWHPGSRLPVLPASALHGPDINLQGLPVLTPAGPGNYREENRPQQHACGQSQGKKKHRHRHQISQSQRFFPECIVRYIEMLQCVFSSVCPVRERCCLKAGCPSFLEMEACSAQLLPSIPSMDATCWLTWHGEKQEQSHSIWMAKVELMG